MLLIVQGALLPQQAPEAAAPSPSNDEEAFGLEALSPAEAQSPLGAAAVSIVDQVNLMIYIHPNRYRFPLT